MLLAAFAAGIGVLAVRRLAVGLVGIAAFAGLGVAAALTRAGADAADTLPALVGGGLGGLVLWAFVAGPWQLDPWPWQPPTPLPAVHPGPPPAAGTSPAAGPLPAGGPPVAGPAVDRVDGTPAAGSMAGDGPAADGPGVPAGPAGGPPVGWEPLESTDPESRRRFLRGAGLLAGAATVVGLGGHWLAGRRGVSAAREAVALPTPSAVAPAVPPGADLSLAQLAPYTTPNAGFYRIDTALVVPQVDPADLAAARSTAWSQPDRVDLRRAARPPDGGARTSRWPASPTRSAAT